MISRNTIIYILIAVAVLGLGYMLCAPRGETEEVTADEIVELFGVYGGYVSIEDEEIRAEIDGDRYKAVVPQDFDFAVFVPGEVGDSKLTISYEEGDEGWGDWGGVVLSFIPLLLFGVLIWLFIRRAQRRRNI